MERFPPVERVMMDGTQRPVQRPTHPEQQKLNYSGNNRGHTRQHLAVVYPNKPVLVLSQARSGKWHAQKFHDDEEHVEGIPLEILVAVDLGFLGIQKQYENIPIPDQKSRGGTINSTALVTKSRVESITGGM